MHRVAGFDLDRERIERSLPNISRALGYLEAEMAQDGAWTATGDFTLADVFLYPILRGLQLTPQGQVGLAQCDHLAAWMAVTENRPSILATRWESEP